ncbi:MAG: hypothetical protein Q7R91_00855 [bacterium]|nr:hypothetical protein [bacterium]
MKYQLPDPAWVTQQKRWKVPAVVITPENGETLVDLAVRIARASVELSPRSSGLGIFDPSAREMLITEEDLHELRTEAETGKIDIDHWKGRSVKLTLKIEGDHISISLNAWADRWDTNATNTIPDFAVTSLGKVLAQASA